MGVGGGQASHLSKASAGLGNPLHQDRRGHAVSQQSPLFKPYDAPHRTDAFSTSLMELLPESRTISSGHRFIISHFQVSPGG